MVYNRTMKDERERDGFPKEADVTPDALAEAALLVRPLMDEKRFEHTIGVTREAAELAVIHGQSERRAALAGLLHDCAKRMPFEEMLALARDNALTYDPEMLSAPSALHGIVGAYIARRDFGVTDEEMLSAIRWHTFGHPGMTDFEKCIFIADATENVTRHFPGLDAMRSLSRRSLNAAAMLLLRRTRAHVLASGYPYFQASRITMDWLENLLTNEERALLDAAEASINP